jgi:hypothetical protein
VLLSANAGSSWQEVSVPASTGAGLWEVWGSGASDVYIVGDKGLALHGSGTSFTAVNLGGVTTYINDVWGSSASDVYLFGGGGLIMHGSASGGFTKQNPGTSDIMMYGWGSADGSSVWINSKNSTDTVNIIWYSGNHGSTWTSQISTASDISALWSTAAGHAYAVGGQILDTTNRGATWNPAGLAPALLFGVGGDAAGTMGVWTVGANGTILYHP